jgi:predicted DNA-binding transcriptional regulator YafY
MSQFERIYKIDGLLRRRNLPTMKQMTAELEVSEPTLKRDLEYMRSRLGAPVIWDPARRGYRYDSSDNDFSLPGFWFSADEIHALLLMTHILDQLQPSFLRDQVKPFRDRLAAMVKAKSGSFDSISSRVSLIATPSRIANPVHLDAVIRATLARRRLRLVYRSRSRQTTTNREVSPGRLVYYRGNWYVDAWCHHANAVRRFALDAILHAEILAERADELPDSATQNGYGIFSGPADQVAVLRFHPNIADWVRTAQWHPEQKLEELPDGGVLLRVPYSNDREILMDILRHGADVEVLEPEALREGIASVLRAAARQYAPVKRAAGRAEPDNVQSAAS